MTEKDTRAVLITGYSSGIGYACAHGLKDRGYRVFASARKQEDVEHSVHREQYLATERRLLKEVPAQPFAPPPQAVLKKLVHALESRRPKPRYYVRVPTCLICTLRPVLSSRGLDRALMRSSGAGTR